MENKTRWTEAGALSVLITPPDEALGSSGETIIKAREFLDKKRGVEETTRLIKERAELSFNH